MGVAPQAMAPPGAADPTDYPALFRTLLVRSTANALATLDTQAPRLDDDARERSLYALGLALNLGEAWPRARDLLLAIAPHMEWQGYRHEWIDYLAKGLAQADVQTDQGATAWMEWYLGRLYHLLNDYTLAQKHFAVARQLAQEIADTRLLARTLERMATSAVEQADLAAAQHYAENALDLLDPDDPTRAHSVNVLGLIALRHGEWEKAINFYEESLALNRQGGVPHFIAQAEGNLAYALMYAKRYPEALVWYQRSIAQLAELGSVLEQAISQLDVGVIYWYLGDYAQALEQFAACEPVFVKTGSLISLGHLHNDRGLTFREMNRYDEAMAAFATSIQIMRELQHPLWTANVLESLGGLHERMGNDAEARARWLEALDELARLPTQPRYLYDLLCTRLAALEQRQGTPAPAPPA